MADEAVTFSFVNARLFRFRMEDWWRLFAPSRVSIKAGEVQRALRRVPLSLFVAGVSACTIHTRTITSDPSGASIMFGPNADSLHSVWYFTPYVFRDALWLDQCFQVKLPGYTSDGVQCLPGGATDQAAHFTLHPVGDRPTGAVEQDPSASAPLSIAVFVTAGTVSQPYEVLGPVHFDTVGMVNVGATLSDALFKSRFERAVSGATPTLRQDAAFDRLRDAAISQYGGAVGAVLNATYRADHDGTVFADGLAVRFVQERQSAGAPQSPHDATERRLQELRDLLDKKLISQKEYERKRTEILDEL